MLKYTNKKTISLSNWDKLVRDTYGKPYNFQQQDGCQERGTFELEIPSEYSEDDEYNDSIPEVINGEEMGVKFAVWLARDTKEWNGKEQDKPYIDMFWERNFYPDIHTLANDLYDKGLIEKGEYVINIDW